MSRRSAWILALLLLSSCLRPSGAMWKRHGMPPPEASWSEATRASAPELAKGQTLALGRACEIALARHPRLAKSRGELEAADARVGQALASYLPQLSVSTGYSRSTSNSAGGTNASGRDWGNSKESLRAGIGFDQLLFDFGRTRAAHEGARHQAAAAAQDLAAAALDLLLEVREAYLTSLAEEALLSVSDKTVESFQGHLHEAERFLDVGRRTPADLARARVDLGSARLERVRTANRAALARVRLNRAVGLEEDPGYRIDPEVPASAFEMDLEAAVREARASRPELRAAWERLLAAEASAEGAWAKYFPSVKFGASYDWTGRRFPLIENWSLGPSVDWDLFNGFRTPNEVREAEARWRASRADLALAAQTAYAEVCEAHLALREAGERTALAAQTLAAARESLRLTQGQYRVGRASLLERTDTELALARTASEEVRARFDYEIGVARMLRAMGLSGPRPAGEAKK